MKSIGEQIRDRRKDLGITQPRLAKLAGISVNTLYKIERGQANPSYNVLSSVAEVLGMYLTLEIKPVNLTE